MKKRFEFIYHDEIGIEIPELYVPYEELNNEERSELHKHCDKICGIIPERIRELEKTYKTIYQELRDQEDDENFYAGVDQLNQLSRNICELNIWYLRMQGKFLTSSVE